MDLLKKEVIYETDSKNNIWAKYTDFISKDVSPIGY
jgi:hypothetical protein